MENGTLGAVTDSGQLIKMEVDYSSTCDQQLPELQRLAADGRLEEALAGLLALEKQTRTGADMHSTSRVLVAIVQACYDAGDWTRLNDNIVALAKRRSQLKQSVGKMVQRACVFVQRLGEQQEAGEARQQQLRLIDTLRAVTEGKIYVEVERARLTHRLANLREADGDTEAAATLMQELQVETYGSMDRAEKVAFILEQMRLCLTRGDYVRTQIISKKINVKFFDAASGSGSGDAADAEGDDKDKTTTKKKNKKQEEQDGNKKKDDQNEKKEQTKQEEEEEKGKQSKEQDPSVGLAPVTASRSELKLKYYRLMIELDQQLSTSLAVCRHYLSIYRTPTVQNNETHALEALRHAVLYLVLASGDNESMDLMHRLLDGEKRRLLDTMFVYGRLLRAFTTAELIEWRRLCADYENALRIGPADDGSPATGVFDPNSEAGRKRWRQLQQRVVEHNIGVLARYYRRIRLQRMVQLLDMQSVGEAEEALAQMVVAGGVCAKTDRLTGVVSFVQPQQPTDVLTEWSCNVDALMSLVNKTTHLINKEEMVHKHLAAAASTAASTVDV